MIASGSDILEIDSQLNDRYIEEVENKLGNYVASKFFCLTASGLSALEVSLLSVGIKPGDIVACDTVFHFGIFAILNVGAIPLPIDIYSDSLTISVTDLSERVGKNVKAVIVTATFGIPPALQKIKEHIRSDIPIILDNAQGFGTTISGEPMNSPADIICYSFQKGKPLSCGYGGGIACANLDVYIKAKRQIMLGWFPRDGSFLNEQQQPAAERELGRSLRLPHIAAYLLDLRLKSFPEKSQKMIEVTNSVIEKLEKLDFQVQKAPKGYNGQRWKIAVFFDKGNYHKLVKCAEKNKWRYFQHSGFPLAWNCLANHNSGLTPVCERFSDKVLILDVYRTESLANK